MSHVCITFDRWLGGSTRDEARKKLVGYQEICCHMIFDIKMTVLVRKAHLVGGSFGPLKQYLGATIKIHTNGEGSESWAMSLNEYVKTAVAVVVKDLDKQGLKLKSKAYRPYDSNYKPELDVTEELDDDGVARFQGYIGMFCRMIELGCIDIMTEVSQLSRFQAMPRRAPGGMLLNICIPEETPYYVHGFPSLMNKDTTGSF